MWIDDFGKFKTGPALDAGSSDAGPDAKSDSGTGKCRDVSCTKLDSECELGVCNPDTGECEAKPAREGESCFDGDACTYGEVCKAGKCMGKPLDCSAFDDECSQGVCDPETGSCGYGSTHSSQPCNDLNDCTIEDQCGDDGLCHGKNADKGASCSDLEECTGTSAKPDSCNGEGHCDSGGPVASGMSCDDDNECTDNDKCNGSGKCTGNAIREGEKCNTACSSNTVCRGGECVPTAIGAAPAYDPRCVLNFCDKESVCQDKWQNDRVCYCGCSAEDHDCSDCSASMCQNSPDLDHKAKRWCDQAGKAIANCPDSLKDNGVCDCGCQYVDPDCSGKDCCSAHDSPKCGNAFVEDCLCNNVTHPEPDCCDAKGKWSQRCVDLAVAYGCMVCPK